MKPNIIHGIVACLAAFVLLLMVACSRQEEALPDAAESVLFLNIATLERTRSGVSELPDNEKMHSVRVVVLHADGTVEHNRHYSLERGQENKYILLKVRPDEKKKIFLFANEESVSAVEGVAGEEQSLTAFFNGYIENSNGFSEAVNGLYFSPDYSDGKSIPMSSMYEIDFTEGKIAKTFYVVRIAAKFEVNFINWRGEEVAMTGFTLASHADRNFLMAHVNDSEQNRELFNGKNWIDWLKEVAEASSGNDDYATTERAGWLKDYELPVQGSKSKTYTYGPVAVEKPIVDIDYPDNSKPGVAHIPVFYLPESMNLKAGAADGEQEYVMTINVKGREVPFVCTLPNLKALFRNTHVVVNITFHNSMEIAVDVIPYGEVLLDPVFGLPNNKRKAL